jgi:hypothetical protein
MLGVSQLHWACPMWASLPQLRNWSDFGFDTVQITAYSTAGTPYQRTVPVGMPKLPPEVLYSPFYLYESVEDAKAGKPFGGTGFCVGYPVGVENRSFVYAVTNWHVAVKDGFSVIRVNKIGGGIDCFDLDPIDWEFLPGKSDIAVASIPFLKWGVHEVVTLTTSLFLDPISIATLSIGPGDNIFMLGRFVDHDGMDANVPSARFGHISVMPQPIKQPNGSKDPSFILDVHSRTGYSGSPVFVYRTFGDDLTTDQLVISESSHFVKLLGIHWGQFQEKWDIGSRKKSATKTNAVKLTGNTKYVEGMSGMTLAAPAWAIMEILG